MKPRHVPCWAIGLGLALTPQSAYAHLISTGLGPVYDGVTHFAMTPEELLPLLALALFAGLRGKAHGRRVIFVLPIAWLLAGVAGGMTGTIALTKLTWLPLLALGVLVASDVRLSLATTTAIAVLLGLFVGLTNGAAMTPAGAGLGILLGTIGAGFVVATLVAAFVGTRRAGWTRIAGRVAGSWIAASGLLLLGWSLR